MTDLITTITATKLFSKAWDTFGKEIASEAKDFTKKKWQDFKLEQAEKNYRQKIISAYGKMHIFGMTEAVPLDDIFVEVEILDKPTAHQRYDIEELLRRSADPEKPATSKRVGGLELVRENSHLFILGKPGAGKTTFLKRVAYNAAEKHVDKLPIFISLKEWSDSKLELLPFIAQQFDSCDFPEAQPFVEKLLKAVPSIVLFDGLDEVNQTNGERDKQLRAMKDFIKKYDKAQCLITCRIAASDYTFEGFKYIEVADFSPLQIKQFVTNWFKNQGTLGEKFLQEFAKEENKNLRELASSPLLLTMLCLLYQETLEFPQRRAEIYEKAMDALLRRWDVSRLIKRDEIYRNLTLGYKENMFAQVAHITFDNNQYFFKKKNLENLLRDYLVKVPPHDKDIDGENLLKAVIAQHGIFTERAENIYSFSHLTFQEYFAAKYIVDNATGGTLAKLLVQCADKRWREIFLLTSSMLPDASKFLTSFHSKLDNFIQQDEVIVDLLERATWKRKASSINNQWTQGIYVYLGLLSFKNTSLNRVAASFFDLTRFKDSKLLFEFWDSKPDDQIFQLPFPLNSKSHEDVALDVALDISLALSLDRAFNRTLESSLPIFRAVIPSDHLRDLKLPRQYARQLDLEKLLSSLTNLRIPKKEDSENDWRIFAEKLRSIMIKHRDIGHPLELTPEQTKRLIDYFNATRLLKDCLELATMPLEKKEEILARLFLPPQH